MKKLFLVVVFVGILSSVCFADILVYKFTANENPYIAYAFDANDANMWVYSSKQTGYLIVDIIDFDIGGFNHAPTIIYYQTKKWYWKFNANISDPNSTNFEMFGLRGSVNKAVLSRIYWTAWETGSCTLYGSGKPCDIGRLDHAKVQVPKSLKGTMECSSDNYEAFGAITATLDAKSTIYANANGLSQSQAAAVITDNFDSLGYIVLH